ncbi:hypothetical protein THARTR1_08422 [Trichoderma harzianum]|uniref:Uncharacterized protein n=1 Tax=Trichoderma harzianum TaxID=5544 RepID=A0A2K0TZ67_TRIHA|nr:hypothetical protein THARTR1_08422 [Trichoderma harzianum]
MCLKHGYAGASHRVAPTNIKACPRVNSDDEYGCCLVTGNIVEGIVSHAVDIAEKTVPKYDSEVFKEHLVELIKKYYPHCAEDDAGKSEKNAEAVPKVHVYHKMAHEVVTRLEEVTGMNAHDVQANKDYFRELGRHVRSRVKHHHHKTADDNIDEGDKVAGKDFDEVSENDLSEASTYVGEEMDGLLTEVDDGATQALRKLVKQVAIKFMIEVVNKRKGREDKEEENEKYDFDFERFAELFEDPANFYTDFDLWGLVELSEDATIFYTNFDFEGFVELFEDEDGYVMVDRNTMMPSATDDEVLATEVTGKAAARTRTWWFFWRS